VKSGVTSLLNLEVPQSGREGPASSVMENDISQLDQELLSVFQRLSSS